MEISLLLGRLCAARGVEIRTTDGGCNRPLPMSTTASWDVLHSGRKLKFRNWSLRIVDSYSQRKTWVLHQAAFDKLLAHLDDDRERGGEKYETIRRKLVRFFEWRGSLSPEDHADEVINRVAKRIDGGEEILDLTNYFYGVARMLFLETLKQLDKEAAALENVPRLQDPQEERYESDRRLECLEMCLRNLPAESSELIIYYYRKEKGAKIEDRKALAERLSIPLNALRIRAHRIRTKIEQCINDCLSNVG